MQKRRFIASIYRHSPQVTKMLTVGSLAPNQSGNKRREIREIQFRNIWHEMSIMQRVQMECSEGMVLSRWLEQG